MIKLEKLNQQYPQKRAFITGAGSGLGAAYAKILDNHGWTLHLSDINRDALEKACSMLKGSSIHLYTLDVADAQQYKAVHAKVINSSGSIDVLINNAGIGDGGLFQEYSLDNWERMIQINLLGTYYGCQFFVPDMLKQKSGLILNIGSAAGFMNSPGMSAYNASKSAVYSLSETLHHELKHSNIRVSVLTPSFFPTNIMQNATCSDAVKNFAEKQMKYSTSNADDMAQVSLELASRGKFQIIHPKEARKQYFLKKWFPGMVEKKLEGMMRKLSSSNRK